MNLQEELAKLSQYSAIDKLVDATKGPVKYCPEPFSHMIPSISIGKDGATLDKLFLVSKSYLCEIRLVGQRNQFDFVAKKTIQHYRLDLSTFALNRDGGPSKVYEIARVILYSSLGAGLQTELSYVGDDRDRWLDNVFDALPVVLLASV